MPDLNQEEEEEEPRSLDFCRVVLYSSSLPERCARKNLRIYIYIYLFIFICQNHGRQVRYDSIFVMVGTTRSKAFFPEWMR